MNYSDYVKKLKEKAGNKIDIERFNFDKDWFFYRWSKRFNDLNKNNYYFKQDLVELILTTDISEIEQFNDTIVGVMYDIYKRRNRVAHNDRKFKRENRPEETHIREMEDVVGLLCKVR